MKIIKKLIPVFFFLVSSINAFSQIHFERGYWLPKAYINGIEKNVSGKQFESYLKPVSAILIKKDKIFIKTYKDEFKATAYKYINKKMIFLKSVMVGLAADGRLTDDPALIKYSRSRYYLYGKSANSMFLIIKGESKKADTVQFSRFINGVPIIDDRIAPLQTRLFGRFDLYSPSKSELERNISVERNGNIASSKVLKYILLKDIPNLYTGIDDIYAEAELQFSNSTKRKVILRFSNSKDIAIYSSKQGRLDKILYFLKRN